MAYHDGSFYPRIARLLRDEMKSAYQAGEHAVINLSVQSLESGVQASTNKVGCSTGLCKEIRREELLLFISILHVLEYAENGFANNTAVVVASGNAGIDLDVQLQAIKNQYPKAWKRVKIVGGTDSSGAIDRRFNSSGSNMVYARGIDVNSMTHSCSGTSFAAPEMARVLDYVWRQVPSLTSEQLMQALDQSLAEESIRAIPQDPTTGWATNAFLNKTVNKGKIIAGIASPFEGTWLGTYEYTNPSGDGGCRYDSGGSFSATISFSSGTISGTASVDGFQLRWIPSCDLYGYTSSSGSITGTASGNTASGSFSFPIAETGSTFSPSFNASLNGDTMSGTLTAGGSGSFTMTRQ
jgi:hypothetical protein